MRTKPDILVLTGDGINCERDTARAFALAGGNPQIVHINDLLEEPKRLEKFQALAFPGGFSFGDDLGSGQVLSLKIESVLMQELREFVHDKKPVIGICNGFQAIAKLGLLPEPFAPRTMALARNTGLAAGKFFNTWVELELEERSPCIWTRQLKTDGEKFWLPIRHGEGRVVFTAGEEEALHQKYSSQGQVPLRYKEDVNGSFARIAGMCDSSGLVFGLMPHPEAAINFLQFPEATSEPSAKERDRAAWGLKVFKNCVTYLKES